jgi:hypothetical protein
MRGFWKWPMGDNLSAAVVKQVGLAGILLGSASLTLVIVVVVLPLRDIRFWVAWTVTVLLLVVGLVVYVRGVALSYRKQPEGQPF